MPNPRGPKYPVVNGIKRCTKCELDLPIDEFYERPGGKYHCECRGCTKIRSRLIYLGKQEEAQKRARQRWPSLSEEEKEASYERNRADRVANPDKYRKYDRNKSLKRHGITADDYEAMLNQQGGVCAICKRVPQGKHGFHLDHDHETGRIRGILCRCCNTALGHFQDNLAGLLAAVSYLKNPPFDQLGR